MLAYRLYHGWHAPTQISFHHLLHDLQTLYKAQVHMGWKQLYYGCLTPLWIQLLNYCHPQAIYPYTSWRSSCSFGRLSSKYGLYAMAIFTLKTPSRKNVVNAKQLWTKSSLKHARIPSYRPWLTISIQNRSWPVPHNISGNGSCTSHNHMHAHFKVAKLQAHLCTCNICQYFHRCNTQKTTDKSLLCPPLTP